MGKVYGYARVSSRTQDLDRQIELLKQYGCHEIVTETASAVVGILPKLEDLKTKLKNGDELVIDCPDRFSRKDAVGATFDIAELNAKGVRINCLDGSVIDTENPEVKLMTFIHFYIAEREALLRKYRVDKARELAKARGVKFGKPIKYSKAQIEGVYDYCKKHDVSINRACKDLRIPHRTFYRLKDYYGL